MYSKSKKKFLYKNRTVRRDISSLFEMHEKGNFKIFISANKITLYFCRFTTKTVYDKEILFKLGKYILFLIKSRH